jgi:hypothetical protein
MPIVAMLAPMSNQGLLRPAEIDSIFPIMMRSSFQLTSKVDVRILRNVTGRFPAARPGAVMLHE